MFSITRSLNDKELIQRRTEGVERTLSDSHEQIGQVDCVGVLRLSFEPD